jgi:tight adherence protein C
MSDMEAYLAFGLTAETLLAFAIGALTFLSAIAVWRNLVEERPRVSRVRAMARRRLELEAGGSSNRKQRRRLSRTGMGGSALKRLRMLKGMQSERIADRLMRAGLRSREAVPTYLMAKLLCPLLFAFLALVLVSMLSAGSTSATVHVVLGVSAAMLGFFAPDVYLSNRAARRRQALQKSIPDGLDLLVICAEAGLTLDAALHRVAEEVAAASPDLADELAVASVELNFLPERRLALLNLARRIDLPAVRGVVNTLIQTERYGTPLAHSLRVLSAEFREQRMLRAEEKAARLPATLTVPMIVFILPTLFVVLIGPAIIDVMAKMAQ